MNDSTRQKLETTGQIFRWITPLFLGLLSIAYYQDRQISEERHNTLMNSVMENKRIVISVDQDLKKINGTLAERGVMMKNLEKENHRQEKRLEDHEGRIRGLEFGR